MSSYLSQTTESRTNKQFNDGQLANMQHNNKYSFQHDIKRFVMKNANSGFSNIKQMALKGFNFLHFNLKAAMLLLVLILLLKPGYAQIDTVTISADYCTIPGAVQLTALPVPAAGSYTFSWSTIPVQTTASIQVNLPGEYSVTVKDLNGFEKTAKFSFSSNLVFNGDFELGNVGFSTSYKYVAPGPDALLPEKNYTVDWDPHYSHKFFWGRDHTSNSGKFMIINGSFDNTIVWKQHINNIIPHTDYYFTAYGISLNGSVPFANLQFDINGTQVGTTTGPLPPHQSSNNPPYNWVQFYGTWNSGDSTSATLSIVDLEKAYAGNDFGLDDISFGTIPPAPLAVNAYANTPCEGDPLQLTASLTGGLPPYNYSWTGPNGFTSNLANPYILNATQADAGIYTLSVTDAHNCTPITKDVSVSVNPATVAGTVTGDTILCSGSTAGLLTLSGQKGLVLKWESAVAPFSTWTDINNTDTTFSPGQLMQTTQFRVVVQNGSCAILNSNTITVHVDNVAPVITKQAENKIVACDGAGNTAELNAWLAENGGALATDEFSTVSWTNDFTGITKSCGNSGSTTVNFSAKDACGNTSITTATFTIQDTTAPVIAALPAPSTIYCPAIPEFATTTSTDACSDITLTFNDIKTEGSCAGSYSITRTWTATDACGNASTASQTITVQDTTAPVIAALPAPATISCPAVPEFATATATDACSDVTLTFNDVRTDGSCAGSYSITRTWTAKDACGNISTASQTISVQDTTAPVLTFPPDAVVNNDEGKCGATVTIPKPVVIENCDAYTLVNNFNNTDDASGFYPIGTTTIVWTATDGCGNASSGTWNITVNDTEKPVIVCPADITVCDGEQPVLVNPAATDNCGIASLTNNAPALFGNGSTAIVWTATDIHGNTTTCTQTITVTPKVTVNAGPDVNQCTATPYPISLASAQNYSSILWTHNGHGSLSDATILNPVYTPSAGETGQIEFTLTAKGTATCGSNEVSDKFILTIYPSLNVDAGTSQTIQEGTSATLNGSISGGSGVYAITWTPSGMFVDNSKLNPVTKPLTSETLFTLSVADALSTCTASDTVTVKVNQLNRPIARDDYATTDLTHTLVINVLENDSDPIGLGLTTSITSNPKEGVATVNQDGTITYTNQPNFTGKVLLDTLVYTICDKGTPVKCASARVYITIPVDREENFEIFNLVTPNGDGQNDYWRINGIDNTENEVTIFNRWGDKIKTFVNYNNTSNRWEGKNNKNEILPDGVYFYIIKVKNMEDHAGWVYVRGKGDN